MRSEPGWVCCACACRQESTRRTAGQASLLGGARFGGRLGRRVLGDAELRGDLVVRPGGHRSLFSLRRRRERFLQESSDKTIKREYENLDHKSHGKDRAQNRAGAPRTGVFGARHRA